MAFFWAPIFFAIFNDVHYTNLLREFGPNKTKFFSLAYCAQLDILPPSQGLRNWSVGAIAIAHPDFGKSVNPMPIRGQIMPTTLLKSVNSNFTLAVHSPKLRHAKTMAIRVVEFSNGGTKLERFLPKNQQRCR